MTDRDSRVTEGLPRTEKGALGYNSSMPRVTCEALALRRSVFGETSQIAEFLTRECGRVALILKGVHRPKARKGGGVDLLDHCQIVFTSRGRSRSLPPLSERVVLSHHPTLRSREDTLRAGLYAVERLRALVPEGQRLRGVFELALSAISTLDSGLAPQSVPSVLFALDGGLLRMSGFQPELDRCVSCGRQPHAKHSLRCVPAMGGVVCSACFVGHDAVSFPLSAAGAGAVRQFARVQPSAVRDVVLPPAIENDVRRFYDRTLLHVLERPPRCAAPAN